jgi:hypothetical protein
MNRPIRPSRTTFRLLEIAFSVVFLGMVVHHVATHDFRPLAPHCAPINHVLFGLATLLFVRGR